MAYRNLREFIDRLDAAGEIVHVRETVSPHLEISRITDRESKKPGGGKGLFFHKVRDSAFPVATNIFGSDRRICMALEVNHLDEPAARIRQYMEFDPPRSLREAFNAIPLAVSAARFVPRRHRGSAPCQEIIHTGDQVDLTRLPVLHCWPQDGGPFVTLPLVATRSPVTGKRNLGMYRMQIFDRRTTGMHWHIHKDGSHYYQEYCKAGKRMPVSVAIGADPATTYAATAPLPRGIDELMLAGFLRKKSVSLVTCITNDLEVPAEAEFVLEGYVDPGEMRMEGPFGDHTGYYSLKDLYPVFHVTAITHRRQAIYNATLVGPPPMEDCYLARATERIFLPLLQTVFPEIRDYWFPWEGVFHNIVIVSIDKAYAGHAQKIMSGLWGQGQMSFCKAITLVDADVNPQNPGQVLETLMARLDIETDLTHTRGVLDVLDHASPYPNFGSKIGIDLTARFPGEPARAPSKPMTDRVSDAEIQARLACILPGEIACRTLFPHLLDRADIRNRAVAITVTKKPGFGGRDAAEAILGSETIGFANIFVLYDPAIDLGDYRLMLWKLFNNVDPGRDLYMRNGRAVIDACKKGVMDGHAREWPEDLSFT